ncbi:glycosyltransferase family 4 protein [Algibacter miyuki]|uniref:Glycosyltransferase family 4 protein n=1 Tax=Algibacter miyuki TaxID=1306933 RepID=A0ABV5H283_9FLAO|nr:glycosyltransferase family 4 protein [Algibacter miyuki]MDN3666510.1 glycosyltransferase family 4 protein [Algibacter miyuki]
MKKILYIGNKLSQKGKTETTIDTLGKGLRNLGFEVVFASSYRLVFMRFSHMLWTVFKHRKSTNYVLIDTYSTLNFYYAYAISQLCRVFKLKYIPILHGGELPKRLENSPKLSKAIFKHAYKNVAPSGYLKSEFENYGFRNIDFIPNSIPLEDYIFQPKTYQTVKLLWVRSFSELYNPTLAIRVLKALKDENIDAKLCMIGPKNDGSLLACKQLAEKLNVDVEFTGKLSKQEWHKKAEAFNVFVNTTTIDNAPVSVIEAMALGLLVVSTNVGGMPFLIEDNIDGLLVPSNDLEAFVDAIKGIMKNSEKNGDIVNSARKKVENYDWEKVKQEWCNLLR